MEEGQVAPAGGSGGGQRLHLGEGDLEGFPQLARRGFPPAGKLAFQWSCSFWRHRWRGWAVIVREGS